MLKVQRIMVQPSTKIFLMGILWLFSIQISEAQLQKGIKVNLGLGKISSHQLNTLMGNMGDYDQFAKASNAHAGFGGGFGAGVYVIYPINEKCSILGEATLHYQQSKLYINYIWDDLSNDFTGDRLRISSVGTLGVFSLNIPLLFRYKFLPKRRLYAYGGFTMTFSAPPSLRSEEEMVNSKYQKGVLITSEASKVTQHATLSKYNLFNLALTLGVEKEGRGKMKRFTFGASSSFNLTASPMYTSSAAFYDASYNNKLLTSEGKQRAGSNGTPSYNLSDYRSFNIMLSVKYKLNSKKKEKAS